ncbi:S41 family peptidase [Echinicola vietnamensis]|uniref:Periplasmic protease n=1 Tax=Echinicola vietnamensis (strain DSM 17526 / LMG 23754 / KMM 6221) TaxID=926556 RepID=L0G038_ECHVK|nr:S41 family peptidase [Echinicola vietnamensis]AGA78653.1 periplasmic protease [Echinicola vietnamensis DSM 17526]
MKIFTTYRWLIALVFMASLSISCSDREMEPNPKPDNGPEPTEDPDVVINEWIQAVMEEVYLWTDTMNDPISLDADPEAYFDALLVNQDRFSVIYPNYEELVKRLEGVQKEAGYQFQLVRASSNSNDVFGVITYVKKGSPAEQAGLKRNDRFFEINGIQITTTNYSSLIQSTGEVHTLDIRRLNKDNGQFEMLAEAPLSLSVVELAENPILLDSIYTLENKKIGYLVYNFFAPGEELESENIRYGVYDQQLEEIFAAFKSNGVDELVLDLRYNGGGYTSSAVHLASLIGKGITNQDIFYYTQYNDLVQSYYQQTYGTDFFNTKFVDKSQNIGNQISSGKLYVLATGNTASASELIINGLRPYMDVVVIGETTYGKNVGSITIQDTENEENEYGLLPIISQSYNKNDESDYATGFVPDITSDEFANNFNILPLGDVNEEMLSDAIDAIFGNTTGANARTFTGESLKVDNSIRHQFRFGQMIEPTPEFK